MKLIKKVVAILIVIVFFSSFTAISWHNEPSTIKLSPDTTPYNILPSYMYNNSSYTYKVGYLNISGYGNRVSYVYDVSPFLGSKTVNPDFIGPILYFVILKVSQKTSFPFSSTSLLAKVQINPSEYTSCAQSSCFVAQTMTNHLLILVRGSLANLPVYSVMTFWFNFTFTPVYNIGPYYLSGKTITLPFQFEEDVSNSSNF